MNKEPAETALEQSKHIYSRPRLCVSRKIIKRRLAFEDASCLNGVEKYNIVCVVKGQRQKQTSGWRKA